MSLKQSAWATVKEDADSDLVGTVAVPENAQRWKTFLAYVGPGLLIAVGYMDPRNWATDLAGGAQFGYIILFLQNKGFRYVEPLVGALIFLIAGCFLYELVVSHPLWIGALRGLLPVPQIIINPSALYLAIGILGATVMPHNLYLHSNIVQTRNFQRNETGKARAIRYATVDSTQALLFALFINARHGMLAIRYR